MLYPKSCLSIILLLISLCSFGQPSQVDSIPSLKVRSLITPVLLTAYGASSFISPSIRKIDTRWYHSINQNSVKPSQNIDDFLQYTPALAVYGLDLMGLKGKHNWKEQTAHLLMAQIAMNIVVRPTKIISHRLRPDGSAYNSFPSGHTSMAFVNAEFLWQEYKHRNKWLAASGYVVAAATGYMRMQENRHWFSDVVAGAGIAMLSTKLTYWAYPRVVKLIKKKRSSKQ